MNDVAFVIILAVGTVANIIFSWLFSIRAGRYHGIYRFFSFESILVLVLLCAPVWFTLPWRWNQLVSWVILVGAIPLPLYGFLTLRAAGKPEGQIENTTVLVTSGVYRYIRHPLYASLILLGTGIFFKNITPTTAACALVNLVAMVATARTEEREMLKKFGDAYARYMERTKMFIPFIV
ncbi:MAG: isoprenylcysteine carboxylmethyltransferase family protein [Ignavibacteriales bacterium]|nr:isoprenylcysteine carboxylmethyltransferase family protein [Ignavibacteriales bacterium]